MPFQFSDNPRPTFAQPRRPAEADNSHDLDLDFLKQVDAPVNIIPRIEASQSSKESKTFPDELFQQVEALRSSRESTASDIANIRDHESTPSDIMNVKDERDSYEYTRVLTLADHENTESSGDRQLSENHEHTWNELDGDRSMSSTAPVVREQAQMHKTLDELGLKEVYAYLDEYSKRDDPATNVERGAATIPFRSEEVGLPSAEQPHPSQKPVLREDWCCCSHGNILPAVPQLYDAQARSHQRANAKPKLILPKKILGFAHAVALDEGPPEMIGTGAASSDSQLFLDGDIQDEAQKGHCGFSVVMSSAPATAPVLRMVPAVGPAMGLTDTGTVHRPCGPMPSPVNNGGNDLIEFGMCHHYTWDGLHCVTHGLTSEHANRCAGRLVTSRGMNSCNHGGTLMNSSCHRCSTQDPHLYEVVCGAPVHALGICRAETCPFVNETGKCPYGGKQNLSVFKL